MANKLLHTVLTILLVSMAFCCAEKKKPKDVPTIPRAQDVRLRIFGGYEVGYDPTYTKDKKKIKIYRPTALYFNLGISKSDMRHCTTLCSNAYSLYMYNLDRREQEKVYKESGNEKVGGLFYLIHRKDTILLSSKINIGIYNYDSQFGVWTNMYSLEKWDKRRGKKTDLKFPVLRTEKEVRQYEEYIYNYVKECRIFFVPNIREQYKIWKASKPYPKTTYILDTLWVDMKYPIGIMLINDMDFDPRYKDRNIRRYCKDTLGMDSAIRADVRKYELRIKAEERANKR